MDPRIVDNDELAFEREDVAGFFERDGRAFGGVGGIDECVPGDGRHQQLAIHNDASPADAGGGEGGSRLGFFGLELGGVEEGGAIVADAGQSLADTEQVVRLDGLELVHIALREDRAGGPIQAQDPAHVRREEDDRITVNDGAGHLPARGLVGVGLGVHAHAPDPANPPGAGVHGADDAEAVGAIGHALGHGDAIGAHGLQDPGHRARAADGADPQELAGGEVEPDEGERDEAAIGEVFAGGEDDGVFDDVDRAADGGVVQGLRLGGGGGAEGVELDRPADASGLGVEGLDAIIALVVDAGDGASGGADDVSPGDGDGAEVFGATVAAELEAHHAPFVAADAGGFGSGRVAQAGGDGPSRGEGEAVPRADLGAVGDIDGVTGDGGEAEEFAGEHGDADLGAPRAATSTPTTPTTPTEAVSGTGVEVCVRGVGAGIQRDSPEGFGDEALGVCGAEGAQGGDGTGAGGIGPDLGREIGQTSAGLAGPALGRLADFGAIQVAGQRDHHFRGAPGPLAFAVRVGVELFEELAGVLEAGVFQRALGQAQRGIQTGRGDQQRALDHVDSSFADLAFGARGEGGAVSLEERRGAEEQVVDRGANAYEEFGVAGRGDEAIGVLVEQDLEHADGLVQVPRRDVLADADEGVRRGGRIVDVDGIDLLVAETHAGRRAVGKRAGGEEPRAGEDEGHASGAFGRRGIPRLVAQAISPGGKVRHKPTVRHNPSPGEFIATRGAWLPGVGRFVGRFVFGKREPTGWITQNLYTPKWYSPNWRESSCHVGLACLRFWLFDPWGWAISTGRRSESIAGRSGCGCWLPRLSC